MFVFTYERYAVEISTKNYLSVKDRNTYKLIEKRLQGTFTMLNNTVNKI